MTNSNIIFVGHNDNGGHEVAFRARTREEAIAAGWLWQEEETRGEHSYMEEREFRIYEVGATIELSYNTESEYCYKEDTEVSSLEYWFKEPASAARIAELIELDLKAKVGEILFLLSLDFDRQWRVEEKMIGEALADAAWDFQDWYIEVLEAAEALQGLAWDFWEYEDDQERWELAN